MSARHIFLAVLQRRIQGMFAERCPADAGHIDDGLFFSGNYGVHRQADNRT